MYPQNFPLQSICCTLKLTVRMQAEISQRCICIIVLTHKLKESFMTEFASFADEDFCYLTTTGRVSGKAHTIEIWFALHDNTVYMLSGGGEKSDWVKNLRHQPDV